MYKLTVFIPDGHLEPVKTALFDAGAGEVGNYANCCWQVLGKGQFKPLAGSRPHIGEQGEVETVDEWRVECVVANGLIREVVAAMKLAHPYEMPAYDVVKLEEI